MNDPMKIGEVRVILGKSYRAFQNSDAFGCDKCCIVKECSEYVKEHPSTLCGYQDEYHHDKLHNPEYMVYLQPGINMDLIDESEKDIEEYGV